VKSADQTLMRFFRTARSFISSGSTAHPTLGALAVERRKTWGLKPTSAWERNATA